MNISILGPVVKIWADGLERFDFDSLTFLPCPMRYTVYEMSPKELSWEVKDVPAPQEVWELAKKIFLADKWWRGPDHPDTPEGNQKYLEFYESPTTLKGKIAYR